jgi:hypothetical protein
VYNLKEAMLAKCYIEVLGLDKHSEAAQRLIKWKQPIDGQVGTPPRFPPADDICSSWDLTRRI